MTPQLDNFLCSSLLLFIQHEVLRQGWAYSNQSSLFYPDTNEIQGLYTYTSPYRPLVNDVSISGANVMSGVFVNGNFTTIGSSGLYCINHSQGSVTFTAPVNGTISGNFAVAEYNSWISDSSDYHTIFTTKYSSNPQYAEVATGLQVEEKTFPAIILVPKVQELLPLCFGGLDNNSLRVRCIVITDSAFSRVAVMNILKNLKLKQLPLVLSTPFDYLGNATGTQPYNYTGLPFNTSQVPLIMSAKAAQIPESDSFLDATKQFGMVDMEISTFTSHQ